MRSVVLPKPVQLPSRKNEVSQRQMFSVVGTPPPRPPPETQTKPVAAAWTRSAAKTEEEADAAAPPPVNDAWADEADPEMDFTAPLAAPLSRWSSDGDPPREPPAVAKPSLVEVLERRQAEEERQEAERRARLQAKLGALERLDAEQHRLVEEQRRAEEQQRQAETRRLEAEAKRQEQLEQERQRQLVEKSRAKPAAPVMAPAQIIQLQPVPVQHGSAWNHPPPAPAPAPPLPGQWPTPLPPEALRRIEEEQRRREAAAQREAERALLEQLARKAQLEAEVAAEEAAAAFMPLPRLACRTDGEPAAEDGHFETHHDQNGGPSKGWDPRRQWYRREEPGGPPWSASWGASKRWVRQPEPDPAAANGDAEADAGDPRQPLVLNGPEHACDKPQQVAQWLSSLDHPESDHHPTDPSPPSSQPGDEADPPDTEQPASVDQPAALNTAPGKGAPWWGKGKGKGQGYQGYKGGRGGRGWHNWWAGTGKGGDKADAGAAEGDRDADTAGQDPARKTWGYRICLDWAAGWCYWGNWCKYRHSEDPEALPPRYSRGGWGGWGTNWSDKPAPPGRPEPPARRSRSPADSESMSSDTTESSHRSSVRLGRRHKVQRKTGSTTQSGAEEAANEPSASSSSSAAMPSASSSHQDRASDRHLSSCSSSISTDSRGAERRMYRRPHHPSKASSPPAAPVDREDAGRRDADPYGQASERWRAMCHRFEAEAERCYRLWQAAKQEAEQYKMQVAELQRRLHGRRSRHRLRASRPAVSSRWRALVQHQGPSQHRHLQETVRPPPTPPTNSAEPALPSPVAAATIPWQANLPRPAPAAVGVCQHASEDDTQEPEGAPAVALPALPPAQPPSPTRNDSPPAARPPTTAAATGTLCLAESPPPVDGEAGAQQAVQGNGSAGLRLREEEQEEAREEASEHARPPLSPPAAAAAAEAAPSGDAALPCGDGALPDGQQPPAEASGTSPTQPLPVEDTEVILTRRSGAEEGEASPTPPAATTEAEVILTPPVPAETGRDPTQPNAAGDAEVPPIPPPGGLVAFPGDPDVEEVHVYVPPWEAAEVQQPAPPQPSPPLKLADWQANVSLASGNGLSSATDGASLELLTPGGVAEEPPPPRPPPPPAPAPAAAPPPAAAPGPARLLPYSHLGDGGGILAHLAEGRCPVEAGVVSVIAYPGFRRGGPPEVVAAKFTSQTCYTQRHAHASVTLSLLGAEASPSHYTLAHRVDRRLGTPYGKHFMRNWSLDASADGVRWVVLRRHIEDRSLTAETPWVAFEIATEYHALPSGHGTPTCPAVDAERWYRHFRLSLGPGGDSEGAHTLVCACLELYGEVRPAARLALPSPETLGAAAPALPMKLLQRAPAADKCPERPPADPQPPPAPGGPPAPAHATPPTQPTRRPAPPPAATPPAAASPATSPATTPTPAPAPPQIPQRVPKPPGWGWQPPKRYSEWRPQPAPAEVEAEAPGPQHFPPYEAWHPPPPLPPPLCPIHSPGYYPYPYPADPWAASALPPTPLFIPPPEPFPTAAATPALTASRPLNPKAAPFCPSSLKQVS